MNTNHKECSASQTDHPEILYVLTTTDLEMYYDGVHGEGSYDKMPDDQKQHLVHDARRGLENVGESVGYAFDFAIEEAGLRTESEGGE